MRRIHLIGLCLLLAGAGCRLPERLFTFLPPTNTRQLCQSDKRFFYSPEFEICFRYPSNEIWRDVEVSGIKELSGTSISSYDFFLPYHDSKLLAFTLYITGLGEKQESVFADHEIRAVRSEAPYLIGRIINDLPPDLSATADEIDHALQAIEQFAKPASEE